MTIMTWDRKIVDELLIRRIEYVLKQQTIPVLRLEPPLDPFGKTRYIFVVICSDEDVLGLLAKIEAKRVIGKVFSCVWSNQCGFSV